MAQPTLTNAHSGYSTMQPRWQKVDALLGGTEAMRGCATRYLPKHTQEEEGDYQTRLATTCLYNKFKKTVSYLSARPFVDGVDVSKDTPEQLSSLFTNIDLEGTSLVSFLPEWFKEGLVKGFAGVIVDFTSKKVIEGRTLADDRKEKLRPYWTLIFPESILDVGYEVVENTRTLVYAKIQGKEDGNMVVWEYFPDKVVKHTQRGKEYEVSETPMSLGYVPLVLFYSDKQKDLVSYPPMLDLADLNIAHWQSSSDQQHILKVARFPLLACSGATSSDDLKIAPNRLLSSSNPAARFSYVEHTGAAIQAGRSQIKDLEDQMDSYGLAMMSKTNYKTATGHVIELSETLTELGMVVMAFENAIKRAFHITADWLGLDEGGSGISLVKEFDLFNYQPEHLHILQDLRERQDISREAYIAEMQKRGVISDEYNPEADLARLQDEQVLFPSGVTTEADRLNEQRSVSE